MKIIFLILFTFLSCDNDGYRTDSMNDKVKIIQDNIDFLVLKYECMRDLQKYECDFLGNIMLINYKYAEVNLNFNYQLIPFVNKFYTDVLKQHSLESP